MMIIAKFADRVFFCRDFQRNRFVSYGAATTGPAVDTLVSKLLRSILFLVSFYWEISSKEKLLVNLLQLSSLHPEGMRAAEALQYLFSHDDGKIQDGYGGWVRKDIGRY
jgi:hypothetical protein